MQSSNINLNYERCPEISKVVFDKMIQKMDWPSPDEYDNLPQILNNLIQSKENEIKGRHDFRNETIFQILVISFVLYVIVKYIDEKNEKLHKN